MSKACFSVVLLLLAGCHQKESKERQIVLFGATTIVAPGAQPIADSVVVIGGTKIRSVGPEKEVTLPQNSDRTDLTGSWIVPVKGSRIAAGETANLIVLHHAPNGAEPANPADEGARIVAGEWQVPKK